MVLVYFGIDLYNKSICIHIYVHIWRSVVLIAIRESVLKPDIYTREDELENSREILAIL